MNKIKSGISAALAVVLSLAVLLGLSGGQAVAADPQLMVGYSTAGTTTYQGAAIAESISATSQGRGEILLIMDAQRDAARQVGDIETLIAHGVDVLVVEAVNIQALENVLQMARDVGVPVIVVDPYMTFSAGKYAGTVITPSPAKLGRRVCRWIEEKVGEGAWILELDRGVDVLSSSAASEGMKASLNRYNQGIAASEYTGGEGARAAAYVENHIVAGTKFDVIVAHGGEAARGAVSAVQAAGLDIPVVCIGAEETASGLLYAGDLAAVIGSTVNYGPAVFDAIDKLMNAQELPDYTYVSSAVWAAS